MSATDHGAASVPDIPVEPGGDSRYPSGMEARVAVLEQLAHVTAASLERIERRLDTGLTHADNRMDRLERRLDTGLTQANDRMDRIERRLDTGLTHADSRMDRIDRQLDMLWGEQHSDFRWLLGIMIAGTGTILACMLGLLGVMAHGFHWL
jgi:hypothetical protein